jgi:Zn-dependent peptidase ImmA (M78 family)
VPQAILRRELRGNEPLRETVDRLARRFKVSTLVVLRRIYDVGAMPKDRFWREYEAEVERLTSTPRAAGGDFYLTTTVRVSKRFARAIVASTWEGRTPFTEAFQLLGFKKMTTFRELGESLGVAL